MTRWERFWFWLRYNASSAPERLLARYLERRGWVVFYLDPRSRTCSDIRCCWLRLYEEGKHSCDR